MTDRDSMDSSKSPIRSGQYENDKGGSSLAGLDLPAANPEVQQIAFSLVQSFPGRLIGFHSHPNNLKFCFDVIWILPGPDEDCQGG